MKENKIHPTAIIGKEVVLGEGNTVGPYSVIEGKTYIGDNNTICSHVVIGSFGEDTRNPHYDHSQCVIRIGDNNIIKEFTALQKPCYEDVTFIGNNVFIMHGVHVPHDTHLYDHAVVTPLCVLGGITKILEGANLGMGCTVNQYTVVGQYSIVATNSACMKNVRPFSRYIPGKPVSVNKYALEKYGLMEYYDEIEDYVLRNVRPHSEKISSIVDEFDKWVAKYGHQTY